MCRGDILIPSRRGCAIRKERRSGSLQCGRQSGAGMPAVQYSVFASPTLPPFAKLIDPNPRITIGLLLVSFSVRISEPVVRLNALILPSPKLPPNNAPAKSPNVDGAMANPHGE